MNRKVDLLSDVHARKTSPRTVGVNRGVLPIVRYDQYIVPTHVGAEQRRVVETIAESNRPHARGGEPGMDRIAFRQ